MRHRKLRAKLERPAGHRRALMRNQVTSLLEHERIETTDAKAKVLRRVADRMITLGKRGTLHARRRALSVLRDREVAAKLFDELAERYAERPGGYTRVLKVRQRVGDAAPMSIVELVDRRAAGAAAEKGEKGKAKAEKAKTEKAKPEKKAKIRGEKAEKPAKAAKTAKPEKAKGKAGGPGRSAASSRRGPSQKGGGGRKGAK
jgi:large subunit ribosomal protein L17